MEWGLIVGDVFLVLTVIAICLPHALAWRSRIVNGDWTAP